MGHLEKKYESQEEVHQVVLSYLNLVIEETFYSEISLKSILINIKKKNNYITYIRPLT